VTYESEDETKARYVNVMGAELGEVFHQLKQEAAFLHLKWNEYVRLFGFSEERIKMLNRAAPGFFWMVERSWWDDLLLHLSRLTDTHNKVLSVQRLAELVDVGIKDEVGSRCDTLVKAAQFATDHRHRRLAHLNIKLALKKSVKPLKPTSRAAMEAAIAVLDDLLLFVERQFFEIERTYYDVLDVLGGADSLGDIVERGLRDRDQQFGSGSV
jgi:hypothetical protein